MSATTQTTHSDPHWTPYSGWRILVPLDETPHARRALVYAQALAESTHGELRLLRASGVESQAGSQSLASYAEHVRQQGVPVQWTVVENQDAESAILDAARTWEPDLITMATRKSSGLDRWLNGSVSDAIIRSANVPVLVVPANWERPFGRDLRSPSLTHDGPGVVRYDPDWPQPLATARPARILVALDGSLAAEQALVPVLRIAELTPANLILLRVAGTDAERTGAEDYVRRITAEVDSSAPGLHVTTQVTAGEPVDSILDSARRFDVDAVAMSTRGLSGLARAVAGSTATGVLEHSTVPLLLVGPRVVSHTPQGEKRG